MSVDARDSRRIKAAHRQISEPRRQKTRPLAETKLLERKRVRVARWLVTSRSISLPRRSFLVGNARTVLAYARPTRPNSLKPVHLIGARITRSQKFLRRDERGRFNRFRRSSRNEPGETNSPSSREVCFAKRSRARLTVKRIDCDRRDPNEPLRSDLARDFLSITPTFVRARNSFAFESRIVEEKVVSVSRAPLQSCRSELRKLSTPFGMRSVLAPVNPFVGRRACRVTGKSFREPS